MAQTAASPDLFSTLDTAQHKELRPPLFTDPLLLVLTIGLVLFSLVMLYSTTGVPSQEKLGDSFFFVKRQAAAAIAGFFTLYFCSRIKIAWLQKISPVLIVVTLGMLLLTFVPGIGTAAGGAQRWIKLGPLRFQPGEFVKLFFVIFIAGFWARHEDRAAEFSYGILKPMLLSAVIGGLLLMQPDFGSASIIILVTLGMALAIGARIKYLSLGLAAVTAAGAVLILVSPYRMARILSFLSPFRDASGKGYQLIQSLIAVGSGQAFGVGLGGSQQKLFFLPAAHTDFIFAVIAEELGFTGCLALLAAFMLLLWRGLRIAGRAGEDGFTYVLAVGLTLVIVLPAFLNIGVVIGLLPTKGLVLPLVGYGGSSLITSLAAIGLLLGIGRDANQRR